MRLYILRWNPDISSYKTKEHLELITHIKNNELPADFNWSIREYENLAKDDMFILQQVGTENDGIAMIGKFQDACYKDDNWNKDSTKIYYANMWIMDAFDCDSKNPLPAKRYEKLFPEINWHSGESGVEVEENLDDKLINQIEEDLIKSGIWQKGELDKFMSWDFEKEQGPLLDDSGIRRPTQEELADGKILIAAKEAFLNNQGKDAFVNLLGCLSDSKILIPMHIEKDEEGNNKFFPMILTNADGQNAYPIFSNEDQLGGQYQKDDCEVYEIPVPLAVEILKEDKEIAGLILDPFTTPFLIDQKLADLISEIRFGDGE